jgi:drug/metabolite transporter (DMT)-like permease
VKPRTKSVLILLAVGLVWGAEYPTIRWAVGTMDSIAFTAVKFLLSAAALLPLALRQAGPLPQNFRGKAPGRFFWCWAGLVTGVVLALETVFLYEGMVSTNAGKAAFIANMEVIVVLLIAISIGRVPGHPIWLGLALGVAGMWLLSDPENGGAGWFNFGDALVLASAVFGGLHVVLTGRYANRVALYRFVTVQLAVTGFICLTVTVARGTLPDAAAFWLTLPCAMFGIFSLSGAVVAQTAAQRHMRAVEVALLLLLEAVFAAIIGAIFLNEGMTFVMCLGAAMMMAGAAVAQIHEGRKGERNAVPPHAMGEAEAAGTP